MLTALLFFLILWVLAGVLLLLFCDRLILKLYPVEDLPSGLLRSLEFALDPMPAKLPAVRVFADPQPHLLAIQSLGGPGLILLSQGCIAQFSEEELSHVLKLGLKRLKMRSSLFDSVCWFFAVWTARIAPQDWTALIYCDKPLVLSSPKGRNFAPMSVLRFWVIFPFLDFFRRHGRSRDVLRVLDQSGRLVPLDKKLSRAAHLAGGQSFLELRLLSPGRRR